MHVAVAPKCNIQCHYCNRRYDCSNESRPGVTSRILTPDEALDHIGETLRALPALRVVGIAGPGDALANPEATLATLRGLKARYPTLLPCISTNGLALPEYADALADLGVNHVTITMNTLKAATAMRIYAWLMWQGRRLRGLEAGRVLLAQQRAGLERLVARGVAVKINSVLIPGVNDRELPLLSQFVRDAGATVHNIMPLMSRPEYGTVFGQQGQPEPTPEALAEIRAACESIMPVMHHCQQCRADAVGFLSLQDATTPPGTSTNATLATEEERQRQALQRASELHRPGSVIEVAVIGDERGSLGADLLGATRLWRYQLGAAHPRLLAPLALTRGDTVDERLRLLAQSDMVVAGRLGYQAWTWLEQRDVVPMLGTEHRPIEELLGVLNRSWHTVGSARIPSPPTTSTAASC